MTILPITLTVAGAAALINIWLGVRVTLLRRRHNVSIGDGGQNAIATRMRAHANFTEYAPFFLILLGLVELADGPATWLWAAAILFLAGRLLHPFGMDRAGGNRLRVGGMVLTWTSLALLACYALAIPYMNRGIEAPISYAEAPRANI